MQPIEKAILRKMYLAEIIGKRHTAIEHLKRGFPKHERGYVDDAVKRLIKQGYILQHRTGYGLHVSLNPHAIPAIEKILAD